MNRRLRKLACFACIALISAAIVTVSIPALAQEPVKIGVIIPVTGVSALAGSQEKRGIDMALEEINEIGVLGGRKVQLIIEDDESRPEAGMDAIHKLIDVNKVPIVVGTNNSAVTLPTATYSNSQGVVQINIGATAPEQRQIGPFFFSIVATSEVIGKTAVDFAIKDSGQKKFGIMVINDAYGVGVAQVMRKAVEAAGGEVLGEVRYEANKADYRAELQRLFDPKPPAILSVAWADASRIIHKQAYEMGLYKTVEGRWYSPYFVDSISKCLPETIENRKGLDLAYTGARAMDFAEKYKKKYGEEPTHYAPLAYDALWVAYLGMSIAGSTDSKKIRDALPKAFAVYRGASNPNKSVDKDGMQMEMGYVARIYKNGKSQLYELK